ncbi:hypothetical protein TRIUR3_10704 [Triticum urartu]|uniref:Uncharacterized protein n=1 Tax=Triticum urartu TaxID=4572 RepID=M7ZEL3_TRIUA|nr:hypothetical protein TRIUR3_10704 [Triticum urartu]
MEDAGHDFVVARTVPTCTAHKSEAGAIEAKKEEKKAGVEGYGGGGGYPGGGGGGYPGHGGGGGGG